ncbi:hypothetical protein RUND412_007984 [Rhizina undulata]
MCMRVVERFAVCKCIYYVHGVDQCSAYGRRGHEVQDKVVLEWSFFLTLGALRVQIRAVADHSEAHTMLSRDEQVPPGEGQQSEELYGQRARSHMSNDDDETRRGRFQQRGGGSIQRQNSDRRNNERTGVAAAANSGLRRFFSNIRFSLWGNWGKRWIGSRRK